MSITQYNSAGTFSTTLDFGNPSTDRTVTIPDASGDVVLDTTTAYNNDTASFIANTLASGAIIERGSNANGRYIKWSDGTMICTFVATSSAATSTAIGALYYRTINNIVFPAAFVGSTPVISNASVDIGNYSIGATFYLPSLTGINAATLYGTAATSLIALGYIAIGRWK